MKITSNVVIQNNGRINGLQTDINGDEPILNNDSRFAYGVPVLASGNLTPGATSTINIPVNSYRRARLRINGLYADVNSTPRVELLQNGIPVRQLILTSEYDNFTSGVTTFAGTSASLQMELPLNFTANLGTAGSTWASMTGATNEYPSGAAYGNGKYVIVADAQVGIGSVIMYSTDLANWVTATYPVAANNAGVRQVCFGNGIFVACIYAGSPANQQIITSTDGINWTLQNTPNSNQYKGVCYGNGLFVSVASTGTGNRVMTSPDGITWTARTSAADYAWNDVCYGNGTFVAVAFSGGTTDKVMTSTDGITWSLRTGINSSWRAVTYTGNKFYAVADAGTTKVMSSTDGITWSALSHANINSEFLMDVCGYNDLVVAANVSNLDCVRSTDGGVTWTKSTVAGGAPGTFCDFTNSMFIMGHDASGVTAYKSFINLDNNICQTKIQTLTAANTSNVSTNSFMNAMPGGVANSSCILRANPTARIDAIRISLVGTNITAGSYELWAVS